MAAAGAGLHAGVVMSLTDFENGEKDGSTTGKDADAVRDMTAVFEGQLQQFTSGNPLFTIERTSGSIRLIRKDTPPDVIERLTHSGISTGRSQISASAGVVEVVGSLIRQQPMAGVLGSGLTPGPRCPLGAPVKIDAGQTTAFDALDSIVDQVPGLSWFVLFDPDRPKDLEVGLWCPDGMHFRVELRLS